MFQWFQSSEGYRAHVESLSPMKEAVEEYLCRAPSFIGYCAVCETVDEFNVRSAELFGDRPNLREGMLCRCGLSNRNRLVLSWIKAVAKDKAETRILALESMSPFFAVLHRVFPLAVGSEFLGEGHRSGDLVPLHGSKVRHEDVTRLSFGNGEFDIVTHNDILEHIYDYRKALNECHRVLRNGGELVFTCPVFDQPEHLTRARIDNEGRAVHLQPAVYHGNPLSEQGSLVFHQFGWPILTEIREAGFREALLGVNFDLSQGFVSNNNPYPEGNMMPILFRAIK